MNPYNLGAARQQLQQKRIEDTFVKGEYSKIEDQLEKGGEGSRGGKIIGHTKSGKAVYAHKNADHDDYKNFTSEDHGDAIQIHSDNESEDEKGHFDKQLEIRRSENKPKLTAKKEHGVTTLTYKQDWTAVLHPEHHEAIKKLKEDEEYNFKDEQKMNWNVKHHKEGEYHIKGKKGDDNENYKGKFSKEDITHDDNGEENTRSIIRADKSNAADKFKDAIKRSGGGNINVTDEKPSAAYKS